VEAPPVDDVNTAVGVFLATVSEVVPLEPPKLELVELNAAVIV
jgi:hypothetical protein